jgi:hypothetical protein
MVRSPGNAVVRDWLADPALAASLAEAVRTGAHANPPDGPAFFTTSYFHTPAELAAEAAEAELADVRLVAVEGFLAPIQDEELDRWLGDAARRKRTLAALRVVGGEASMLSASGHLLAIGTRPHSCR